MLGIIKRLWTKWKIQRLKARHHLNFELMRKENLPHDVIQDELLKQVADEYAESPKNKKP